MNKIKFISLTAGIMLAMVSTLSCPGDDGGDDNPSSSSGGGGGSSSSNPGGDSSSSGGGGGVNSSELSNKQVYLVEWSDGLEKKGDFDGNGTLYLKRLENSIPVGEIQNGILSLNLSLNPNNLPSEYLNDFLGDCEQEGAAEEYESCESHLSYPANLSYLLIFLDSDIPSCDIKLYTVKSDEWLDGPDFIYFSKSGTITGTETSTDYEGRRRSSTWNMNVSEGLNYLYGTYERRDDIGYYTYTSTSPAGAALEWGLECYN
jgi:hypothetical protein